MRITTVDGNLLNSKNVIEKSSFLLTNDRYYSRHLFTFVANDLQMNQNEQVIIFGVESHFVMHITRHCPWTEIVSSKTLLATSLFSIRKVHISRVTFACSLLLFVHREKSRNNNTNRPSFFCHCV